MLRLTEVDPFGNYSSPHHKGTAILYRVTRGQLGGRGDGLETLDARLLGDPVCKLALTLPKVRERFSDTPAVRRPSRSKSVLMFYSVSFQTGRSVSRPAAARVKPCEETGA